MLLFSIIYKTTASKEFRLSAALYLIAAYAKVYNFLKRQIVSMSI